MAEVILSVRDLKVDFPTPYGELAAVRGVSFDVREGQTFGIVGESGCGKSVTGRAVMGLVPSPGRISGGQIVYHGEDLVTKNESALRALRGRRIAMVFQDPAAALNPLFTVGSQITGIMRRHRIATGAAARRRAMDLFGELGLPQPDGCVRSLPARTLWRHATARHAVDGARRRTRSYHRRRGYDRARCDDPGANSRPTLDHPAQTRVDPGVHHPRSGPGGRDLRSRRGPLHGPYRRRGGSRQHLSRHAPPLHQGIARRSAQRPGLGPTAQRHPGLRADRHGGDHRVLVRLALR